MRIREAQKHTDPADPDPDADLDEQHCLKVVSLQRPCFVLQPLYVLKNFYFDLEFLREDQSSLLLNTI
jgi:hypothetical protein